MKEKLKWIVVSMLFIAACSPVRVTPIGSKSGFTLQEYKSFAFLEENTLSDSIPAAYSGQVDFLKREIRKQLQARGLAYNPSQPDLQVNIGVMVDEKVQTRETSFRQDAPYYTGQRRYHWESEEIPVRTYKQGIATIHLVNREQNELVWAGEVSSVLPRSEESIEERIAEAIEKLFKQVP